jgi:hypothetical protein
MLVVMMKGKSSSIMFIKVIINYEATKPTINKSNPTPQKISALICRVFLVVAKKVYIQESTDTKILLKERH